MNNEFNFLIHLLSFQLGYTDKSSLQNLKIHAINWDNFVSLVIRHKLTLLIHSKLQELNITLPPESNSKLLQHCNLEQKKNFLLTSSLINVNKILEKEFEILWFKGPVQSIRLYSSPFVRSYSDIDLLIKFEDLEKVNNELIKLGYIPKKNWTNYPKSHLKKYLKIKKEFSYIHHKTKVCIDLHWKLVFTKELLPYSFDELYQNADSVEISGSKIRTLSRIHNFYYLNIHGCNDNWDSLTQLLDISYELSKNSELKDSFINFTKENKLKNLDFGIDLHDFIFKDSNKSYLKLENHIYSYSQIKSFENTNLKILKRVTSFKNSIKYKYESFLFHAFYLDSEKLIRLPHYLFWMYYSSIPIRWIYNQYRLKIQRQHAKRKLHTI